ncbi:MAG: GNAT family N-acetyltransferase, partial [Candidatus Heimdallarchaeota archaeon]|nr:GNAT family N-acetyltransferase [Candidatus Heimdallarchaeota archaeon]
IEALRGAALVRELHVYGSSLPLSDNFKENSYQHQGFGNKLLIWAEQLARDEGYDKIAIISGVGVREYYRKFDYKLQDVYMIKSLSESQ